jgi:hypothetical protein
MEEINACLVNVVRRLSVSEKREKIEAQIVSVW